MGFLINNTTPMTFNMVYWAPIALDSASWELSLKPSLYNYCTSQLTITFIHMKSASWELALKPSLYNNRPKHSKYFCAGNTRLPRTSNLAHETPTSRTPGVSPGENTHIPRTSVSPEVHTHVNHRVSGASLQAALASGNSLHDSRCLHGGLRTILSYAHS